MPEPHPQAKPSPPPAEPSFPPAAPAPAAPGAPAPIPAELLSPEEQMERFAQELKENDWGHQPC